MSEQTTETEFGGIFKERGVVKEIYPVGIEDFFDWKHWPFVSWEEFYEHFPNPAVLAEAQKHGVTLTPREAAQEKSDASNDQSI